MRLGRRATTAEHRVSTPRRAVQRETEWRGAFGVVRRRDEENRAAVARRGEDVFAWREGSVAGRFVEPRRQATRLGSGPPCAVRPRIPNEQSARRERSGAQKGAAIDEPRIFRQECPHTGGTWT